jgi:subtilisin family serine protease
VLKVFDSNIFTGVSVEIEEDNIDTIEAIQSVSRAWSSNKIKLAPHIPTLSFSDDASASVYTVHNWTGVDRLHAAGIKGKGAVVAVVDTGIQYTHPDVS